VIFWNLIIIIVAKPCEYTDNHYIVHLKCMDFMACELCQGGRKEKREGGREELNCGIGCTSSLRVKIIPHIKKLL
jgi:hypothetical protein